MIESREETFGSLRCIVVDGSEAPDIAVVICHGYGASYHDLAPLSAEWVTMLGTAASRFRFVFPDAPHSLDAMGLPGGRAWWPINMTRLAEAVQASRFDELHDEIPPGMDEARAGLEETISAVLHSMSGSDAGTAPRLVLGGFSQGAMLTMDTAVRGQIDPPELLIQFSGTVVCRPAWKAAAATRLVDTHVYQSHGQMDPILPYESAEVLRDLLLDADVNVDFHAFQGPHTIDGPSVEKIATLLGKL